MNDAVTQRFNYSVIVIAKTSNVERFIRLMKSSTFETGNIVSTTVKNEY